MDASVPGYGLRLSRDVRQHAALSLGSDSPAGSRHCQQLSLAADVIPGILTLTGLGILLVLAFTKRRVNLCRGCCDGRPGLVTPLNTLTVSRYRLVYTLIFGLMSNAFLSLAITNPVSYCDSEINVENAICKTAIAPVFLTVAVCLLYAPLFMCVDPPHLPLLGHLLGLFYLSVLATYTGVQRGYQLGDCAGLGRKDLLWAEALSDLPYYAFIVILFVWFACKTVIDIVHLSTPQTSTEPLPYHLDYVKRLLASGKKSAQRGRLIYWLKYIWPYEKGFKYPLKFLGSMIVVVTIMFKLMYLTLYLAAIYDKDLKPSFESFAKNNSLELFNDILRLFDGTLIVAPFVSSGLCLLLILHMARSVHNHMKQVARGQFKLPPVKPKAHFWKLDASLKYFGYQIGFFVWAWLTYYGATMVIGLLVVSLHVGLNLFPEYTQTIIVTPVLVLVWLTVVYSTEILLCKFVFLDSKEESSLVLRVTNRNAFNWFAYFFFVFYSIVGFVGAILRLLLSLLLGTLLLFRLDQNIMMAGFQFADWGHNSYKGFLYVEHTHNNPIVHAFVALLSSSSSPHSQQHQQQQQQQSPANDRQRLIFGSIQQETTPLVSMKRQLVVDSTPTSKQRIRNRWLVAYTLVRNPSLRPLTAARLREQRREVLAGEEEASNVNPFATA